MRYREVIEGKFINRPNRFIAIVEINGRPETVHVKNTGRCRELLIEGVKVILSVSDNPDRKTKFDLVAVYKKDFGLINIDSQAPNQVVKEWLQNEDYDYVKPEYKFGNSRIDFYMEKAGEKYLMEVKGCTLERDGVGYFPDAPTERGIKHLEELAGAVKEGYHSVLCFVIQMEGVTRVLPNTDIHPEFGVALEEAQRAGVQVIYKCCCIHDNGFEIK